MDNRKELKNLYKSRPIIGGVYCITCGGTGRVWIKSARDMRSQINKFDFSVSNASCPEPGMHTEWVQYGIKSFSFTVLEELEKGPTQTDAEFTEDLAALLELWLEKQEEGSLG